MNVLMVYLFITIIGSTQSQEDIENLPQLSPGDGKGHTLLITPVSSHPQVSNFITVTHTNTFPILLCYVLMNLVSIP